MANPSASYSPGINTAEGPLSNTNKEVDVRQCSLKSNRIDSQELSESQQLLPKTNSNGNRVPAEHGVVEADRNGTITDAILAVSLFLSIHVVNVSAWMWQHLCYLSIRLVNFIKQFLYPTNTTSVVVAVADKTQTKTLNACEFKVIPSHTKIVVEISKIHKSKKKSRFFLGVWYRKTEVSRWKKAQLRWSLHPHAIIENLQPAAKYEILLQAGSQHQTAEALSVYSSTLPAGPPEQFEVYRAQDDVVLSWNFPSVLAPGTSVSGYTLKITTIDPLCDNSGTTEVRQISSQEFVTQAVLPPDNSYRFELYTNINQTVSSSGAQAELMLYKHKLLSKSSKMQTRGKPAFQLPLRKTSAFYAAPFKMLELGTPCHLSATEKVILIIGTTGAGKTTLINSLINYLLDVEYSDGFRFKIVSEPPNADQSISQTANITPYKVHFHDGMKTDYTLTIIDTPGFGDTRGVERDKEVAIELHDFFKSEHGVVDHLDALGFVAPASLPRLTHSQTYIFNSILSLFGKDIARNIFLLLTFADGKPPQTLSAFKAANFPYRTFFKFNNSAIFDDVGSATVENLESEKPSSDGCNFDNDDENYNDDNKGDFNEMFWNLGMHSFDKFLKNVFRCSPVSLKLTQEVMEQRGRIDLYIEELQNQVIMGLAKQEQLRVEQKLLRDQEAKVNNNKNFTYTVKEPEVVKLPIKGAQTNTTCVHCNVTCHKTCSIEQDEAKHRCWAMQTGTIPVKCRICPNHCQWDVHKNTKYHYVTREVWKERTSKELKARYETAQGKRLSARQIVKAIWEEFAGIEAKTMYTICEIRDSLAILKNIALKDNPLGTVEYIDIMIQSEKQNGQPGWQTRCSHLFELRKKALHLQEIAKGDYDPFVQYKKHIDDIKASGIDIADGTFWTQEVQMYKNKISGKITSCVLQWWEQTGTHNDE